MDNNKTHLSILLDRSGSMGSCWSDTIGGLETFFQEQKALPGEMTVSIATFDSEYNTPYVSTNIQDIKTLKGIAVPRGGTALYDSFCKLVDSTGVELGKIPEEQRPGKVVFMVVTDGEENSSVEFNGVNVKERLERQRDVYKWNFMFLGADFDANKLGASVGLAANASANYRKGSEQQTFSALSRSMCSYRGKAGPSMDAEDYAIMKSGVEASSLKKGS